VGFIAAFVPDIVFEHVLPARAGLAVPLAVVLCVCSEADAFVAASLVSFSTTAKLAFMMVGPALDLKIVAMQT
jgi:uncharacterized membrane protein YraQ (UPF0718 family)